MSDYRDSCYFHSVLRDMSVKLHYCDHPDNSDSHFPLSSCSPSCPFYMDSKKVFDFIVSIERILRS